MIPFVGIATSSVTNWRLARRLGDTVRRYAQDKLFPLEDIDKTRIGLDHRGNDFYHASQDFGQRIGSRNAVADFMQHVQFDVLDR